MNFKVIEKHKALKEREICLFGCPVVQYGEKNTCGFNEKYFSVLSKTLEHQFLDRILDVIGDNHDLVFIIRTAGMGEAYLLNFMFDEIVQKYNAKTPCIVTHRQAYKDMYDLYLKDVPIIVTSDDILAREYHHYLFNRVIYYKNKNFLVVHTTVKESNNIYIGFSKGYKTPYPIILRDLFEAEKFVPKVPCFSERDKSVVDLVKNLNLDNFVFILPEATAHKRLSEEYWQNIISSLKSCGYDVFANTVEGRYENCISADITIPQAMYLASLSKGIVSIRTGLMEVLSSLPVQKHVLYTSHRFTLTNSAQAMETLSIRDYPMVDKDTVFEYDTQKLNENEIIMQILTSLTDKEVSK